MPEEFVNQLHYGDNLGRLRGDGVDKEIPDEIADLIYLDPPFNSARNYNLLFKQHKGQESPAQIMGFEDTWTYSPHIYENFKRDPRNSELFELMDALFRILGPSEMMAYLLMMAPRLLELHKKLKPTGSLYLHCDPVASHYLKLILDKIFGPTNFRNEITWKRSDAHNDAKKQLGRISDRILFYGKTSEAKFYPIHTEHTESHKANWFTQIQLPDGSSRRMTKEELNTGNIPKGARRFSISDLSSPNPRPNLMYEYKGYPYPPKGWRCTPERMAKLDEEGRLIFPNSPHGRIVLKKFLDEQKGIVLGDLWTDIPLIRAKDPERRGYPTQKPLALLERIISASTDEGDVVLDPFAGCGTSIVAAERMNRKWIGIDITYLAINEVIDRLRTEKVEGRELKYELLGTPKDEDAARALFQNTAHQNHKPFEQWAVTLVGGRYNEKKGADRGIDGVVELWDMKGDYAKGVIQVKGGNGLNLSNVRDFASVIESNKAVFGIMISQKEPTKEMKLVAEGMGYADWPSERKIPRYQILTTEGILERGEYPIIPQSWRIQAQTGVGKAQAKTGSLFDSSDEDDEL